ncbi:LrgB family protein [Paenibacillus larvae]
MIMASIACFLLTVVGFFGFQHLYKRTKKWYFTPLLAVPSLLIVFLLLTDIPLTAYNQGTKWLSNMLQPATVAFAIPLYKFYPLLKKHAAEIISSVLLGSAVAVVTSVLLLHVIKASPQMIESMIPRSITTPIAMKVSESLGGIPAITAAFVILTGIIGSMIGPIVIEKFRIRGNISRGVLLGMGAHGAGTSKAYELGNVEGAIASVSMIIAALATLMVIPISGFLN